MNAREIEKIVDLEGRRFFVRKYDVFTGVMMAKLFTAKILPIFQAFIPMLSDFLRTGELRDGSSEEGLSLDAVTAKILDHLQDFLNLEGIARALDLVEESDLRYIMSASLTHCFEDLSAGRTQVMRKDGTYGVTEVEHDASLALRLVCESVLWGLSDFFTADRLRSLFAPLSSSFRQSPLT